MRTFWPSIRIGLLDMRGDLRRFLLLVVCLAVGTALIAGVNSVGTSITRAVEVGAAEIMGGRIALADDIGVFGNPTSDSARTMVTTDTTRALVVVFAPRDVDASRLAQVLDTTSSRMAEFTGCREASRWTI